VQSLDHLRQAGHELNAAVHPGRLARAKGRSAPFEKPEVAILQDLGRLQRTVLSNSCLLFAAFRRSHFDKLTAAVRAQFDWLIGKKLRKVVRSGFFGLK
jgi:hypothetical protein